MTRPISTSHTIEREGDHVVVRIDAREKDCVLILFQSFAFGDFPSGWVVQEGQISREIPMPLRRSE